MFLLVILVNLRLFDYEYISFKFFLIKFFKGIKLNWENFIIIVFCFWELKKYSSVDVVFFFMKILLKLKFFGILVIFFFVSLYIKVLKFIGYL